MNEQKDSLLHIVAAAVVSIGICVTLSEFMQVLRKMSDTQISGLLLVCMIIYAALYFSSPQDDL